MSIFRTIAMFLYLFGYMIVHYGTLRRGERAKRTKNGLTYLIWFERSRYNYIDYEIGHGNVEVGFTGIDDDIHVGAVHQVFQDAKLLFGTSRHQIFIIYLFVLRSTAI